MHESKQMLDLVLCLFNKCNIYCSSFIMEHHVERNVFKCVFDFDFSLLVNKYIRKLSIEALIGL